MARVTDADSDGKATFNDFVEDYGYQYGPHLGNNLQGQEFAHGQPDHDKAYAMAVVKNIASENELLPTSVAINQTGNFAVVALAEADPDDPARGTIHYVALVAGQTPRTYMFSEKITIEPDGTIKSEMTARGTGWDMFDIDEQGAYGRLVEKFANVSNSEVPSQQVIENIEKLTGDDMALGGKRDAGGEIEVGRNDAGDPAVSTAAVINQEGLRSTVVEVMSSYARSGEGGFLLKIFRTNAEGELATAEASAKGPTNTAKHESFSNLPPGIFPIAP